MERKTKILMALLLLVSLLAACSSNQVNKTTGAEDPAPKPAVNNEPVELLFFGEVYTEKEFKELVEAPLKQKFPQVTFKYIKTGKGSTLPELIASNQLPDIVFTNNFLYPRSRELGLEMDLSSLIKTYKFDLNRLDPSIIPNVKVYGQGKIPFIPLFRTSHTLIYNKDIFDKFGVAYPPDGMTWDAATDLARKVTRTVDGVGYFGMGLDRGVMVDYNQLSISVVDPKTNKATVNNDQWKRVFETFKRFYDMPNSELPKDIFNIKDIFLKDKTLAMRVGHNQIYQLEAANKNGLNFDFATLPTFAEKPETGIQLILPSLMIPNTTKHKDLIFQMIAYLLSDEVQAQYSKTGYQSVLANSKVNSEFAKDLPWLQGKNVQAIIKLKVAATPPPGDYDIGTLNTELISSFKESVYNGKDVNTSLREAEERINKLIEEERKK